MIAGLITPYLRELGEPTEYEYLPCYWTEPESRFAYLIEVDGVVAGFALVRHVDGFEMAEFYVAPGHRGKGAGRAAVERLLRKHPGDWTIGVARNNPAALAFWPKVPGDDSRDVREKASGENRIEFAVTATGRGT